MKRKRFRVETDEERAERERGGGAPQREPDCRQERIEAEIASKTPGAAGLTARSKRPKC